MAWYLGDSHGRWSFGALADVIALPQPAELRYDRRHSFSESRDLQTSRTTPPVLPRRTPRSADNRRSQPHERTLLPKAVINDYQKALDQFSSAMRPGTHRTDTVEASHAWSAAADQASVLVSSDFCWATLPEAIERPF